MAAKAKTAGNTKVLNLQESLVEVHVHGDTKRKVELPARPGKGKDVKKVRAALLGQGSLSGAKGPEVGLIELPETSVRKDIDINLPEIVINSIDSMEPDHLVRRSRRKRLARRRMWKLPWRVMITMRRRTSIFYDLKLIMSTMFVIIRTLFYFIFNMINAFVYAMFFIGCR